MKAKDIVVGESYAITGQQNSYRSVLIATVLEVGVPNPEIAAWDPKANDARYVRVLGHFVWRDKESPDSSYYVLLQHVRCPAEQFLRYREYAEKREKAEAVWKPRCKDFSDHFEPEVLAKINNALGNAFGLDPDKASMLFGRTTWEMASGSTYFKGAVTLNQHQIAGLARVLGLEYEPPTIADVYREVIGSELNDDYVEKPW